MNELAFESIEAALRLDLMDADDPAIEELAAKEGVARRRLVDARLTVDVDVEDQR